MEIIYHDMSLFDAPKGSCLVHATNCQGVWGSGIAKVFKEKFPSAFLIYNAACLSADILGSGLLIRDDTHYVGCLNTSFDYGPRKDPPAKIIESTKTAIASLLQTVGYGIPIYSNKFNSGLFDVPWEQTEALIREIDDDRIWNVCDLQTFHGTKP